MRISIPNITSNGTYTPTLLPTAQTIQRLVEFLGPSTGTAVLTGAGVSVDSGIRAYRGEHGRYINPNYKPILYQELVDKGEKGVAFRKRYWLRSYLGYPPVRDAMPNTSHTAIAAGTHGSIFKRLITQNVDGLHLKALRPFWDASKIRDHILELHGTLFRVHCQHGHAVDRDEFQDLLSESNPEWKEFADELERKGQKPRTNPDGDVVLEGVTYDEFVVPNCRECLVEGRINSVLKPDVVFFGESIHDSVKDSSFRNVEDCDRLLVIGTTLATYSAFRIVRHALELKKPVFVLNTGPTRADELQGIEKVDGLSGSVLPNVVRALLGSEAVRDPTLNTLLSSGVIHSPPDDVYDVSKTPR